MVIHRALTVRVPSALFLQVNYRLHVTHTDFYDGHYNCIASPPQNGPIVRVPPDSLPSAPTLRRPVLPYPLPAGGPFFFSLFPPASQPRAIDPGETREHSTDPAEGGNPRAKRGIITPRVTNPIVTEIITTSQSSDKRLRFFFFFAADAER